MVEGSLDIQNDSSSLERRILGYISVKVLTSNAVYPAGHLLGFTFQDSTLEFSAASDRARLRMASAPRQLPAGDYELEMKHP
jgi:hypothetical protein